jgi:His-Xaa-Ser system protein HxsD
MNSVTGEARTVLLSRAAFSIEAVKRASYSLMAQYDVSVELSDDDIVCTLTPANKASSMESAERDFRREVVDHDLRISIEQRTEAYRDTILGLAFSRTGLQDG